MAGDRKQQILEATLELLAERPLAELSTRRIAKRVGISQPALFRHFRSRDAMLAGAVEFVRAELAEAAADLLAGPAPPLERAAELARALALRVQAHPGMLRLLLSDVAEGTPTHARLGLLVDAQRRLAAELVREAGFRQPERAAQVFVAIVQGTLTQWQLAGRPPGVVETLGAAIELWTAGVRAMGPVTSADAGAPTAALAALDVRPILESGEDPLDQILRALGGLRPDGVLCLTVPFRPTPLIALLGRRGYTVEVLDAPGRLVLVEILGPEAPPPLELRDRPPPEPLEEVLVAASQLSPGQALFARVPRYPRLLMPQLIERGLDHAALELHDGTGRLHLRCPE